jgi:hypothetical protein
VVNSIKNIDGSRLDARLAGVFLPAPSGPEGDVSMSLNQRAEKARKELFARYDQLNALWEKAEERLTRFHVPTAVQTISVDYCDEDGNPDSDPDSGALGFCLGLQKIKGKWRICYGEYYSPNQREADWQPITECSAEIRVDAVRLLPHLEMAVVESAEKFIPRVDSAIQSLTEALGKPDNIEDLLAERARLNGKAE